MDQNIRPIEACVAAEYSPPHGGYPDAPSKPFMEALADVASAPLALPPQFILVLQDQIDAETGETRIDVAGVQRPEAFDHTSPSHVVGTWIRTHLPEIFEAARRATIAPPQQLRLPDGSVVGPRTLLIG